jgi:uncharacterized protein YggE
VVFWVISAAEERRRDDRDALAQRAREASDLQHQARQLISQSQVRITRIGEVSEKKALHKEVVVRRVS